MSLSRKAGFHPDIQDRRGAQTHHGVRDSPEPKACVKRGTETLPTPLRPNSRSGRHHILH